MTKRKFVKSEYISGFPFVVIEQYPGALGSRIAKFGVKEEAQMFCDLMNDTHPNLPVPYVVRKLVKK